MCSILKEVKIFFQYSRFFLTRFRCMLPIEAGILECPAFICSRTTFIDRKYFSPANITHLSLMSSWIPKTMLLFWILLNFARRWYPPLPSKYYVNLLVPYLVSVLHEKVPLNSLLTWNILVVSTKSVFKTDAFTVYESCPSHLNLVIFSP